MRLVIVDDDRLAAMSLETILKSKGFEVLATGASGGEAVQLYLEHRPDVLLMDIRMQGESGLDAAEKILAKDPQARILFLTTFSDDAYIRRALSLGAMGYLLKQDYESLPGALEAAVKGQTVFGEGVAEKLPGLLKGGAAGPESSLTERESELMRLVAAGLNNREIAARLYLSEGRVRNALSTILEKLALRDRTQLAVYYHTKVKPGNI